MPEKALVLVAGLGEVGRPLLYILAGKYDCAGIDIEPVEFEAPCSVLHICYPFQIGNFVGATADYIRKLRPKLTIIHSSVPPGTTREIQSMVPDCFVAYSPVRGKHAHMEADMMRYRKFVAAPHPGSLAAAREHLIGAGFRVAVMSSPELAELVKLLEATYFGVFIAWTQEMERLAAKYDGSFSDVNSFIDEIESLPSRNIPGVITSHCVLPNIDLLRKRVKSRFCDLILESESGSLKTNPPLAVYAGEVEDENRTDQVVVLGA